MPTLRRYRARDATATQLRGLLPDGDVLAALVGERRAVPVLPAVTQPQAGDAGHEVELGGPHVAEGHRERPPLAVFEVVVVRCRGLRGEVVLVEAEMGRVGRERTHSF